MFVYIFYCIEIALHLDCWARKCSYYTYTIHYFLGASGYDGMQCTVTQLSTIRYFAM